MNPASFIAATLLEDDDGHRFAAVVVLRNPDDPETLLVQRDGPPEEGMWASPGGHMNIGETFVDGASRELVEETKVQVSPEDLHFLCTVPVKGQPALTQIFWCVVPDESKAKAGDDASKLKWMKVSSLPTLAFESNEHVEQAAYVAFGDHQGTGAVID